MGCSLGLLPNGGQQDEKRGQRPPWAALDGEDPLELPDSGVVRGGDLLDAGDHAVRLDEDAHAAAESDSEVAAGGREASGQRSRRERALRGLAYPLRYVPVARSHDGRFAGPARDQVQAGLAKQGRLNQKSLTI